MAIRIQANINILELLKKKNKNKNKAMTSVEISKAINTFSNQVSSQCYYMFKSGLVEREQRFNAASGKSPWYYTITRKGRRYLTLRKQLKAMLNETE